MSNYFNERKWRRYLKESKRVRECGEMPPMPSAVPIPSADADPMALGVELGGLGLDPATAQSVIDLLLSKGLLGGQEMSPDVPPVMEYAMDDGSGAADPLAQYSEEAVEAAKAALEAIPDAGAHSGAALENEIHHYLEQGFGETKRPREIFKIGDEALAVAGVILGLGPDAL